MANPSRVEQILKSMLGLAEDIPKPQSRVEELLIDLKQAIESGGSGDLTEIVGRISTLESDVSGIKMVDDAQNKVLDELDETCIRNTDIAQYNKFGIVSIPKPTYGITSEDGMIQLTPTTEEQVRSEENGRYPLFTRHISIFMNEYGIDSIYQIPNMMAEIENSVKNTDYATSSKVGVVAVNPSYGLGVFNSSHHIYIVPATNDEIDEEQQNRKALTPLNISYMMSRYGIESRDYIPSLVERINRLEAIVSAE